MALLEKLRGRNRTLREFVKGEFYSGIITGFNKAFIINQSTRDWLVSQNRRNAEIIKPWLRGRDIRRWSVEWAGYYVILTRHGLDIDLYPAVRDYLAQFKERLMPGSPGGRSWGNYQWYEIQNPVNYYHGFTRPKIIWRTLTGETRRFGYDESGLLGGSDTTCFSPATDLFLLAVLNSPVAALALNGLCDRVEPYYLRVRPPGIEQVPVPTPTPAQRAAAQTMVRELLKAKERGAPVAEKEAELNELVYQAYGLTAAEIRLIEETVSQADD